MKTKMIKAADLKMGDTISMEYGDDGNFVVGTVIGMTTTWWGSLVIQFQTGDLFLECCPDRNGMMDIVVG